MAREANLVCLSMKAAADLSDEQFYFVAISSDNTVALCSSDGQKPLGVLQDAPSAAGQTCAVAVSGVTKVVLGETVVAGEECKVASTGKAIGAGTGTTAGDYVVGQFLEGGDAGEVVSLLLQPMGVTVTTQT